MITRPGSVITDVILLKVQVQTMRTIKIIRNNGWYGVLRTAIVLIDGQEVGRIKCGQTIDVQLPDTAIEIVVKMDWGRSKPYAASGVQNGQAIFVNGWFTLNPLRNLGLASIPIAIEDQLR